MCACCAQGGFEVELFDSGNTLVHRWNGTSHWGAGDETCAVDGTLQTLDVTLPATPCNNCTLRLLRQAREWGGGYLFKSCAPLTSLTA